MGHAMIIMNALQRKDAAMHCRMIHAIRSVLEAMMCTCKGQVLMSGNAMADLVQEGITCEGAEPVIPYGEFENGGLMMVHAMEDIQQGGGLRPM
eukprot:4328994-Ditylum_brightwellii.AAC.1